MTPERLGVGNGKVYGFDDDGDEEITRKSGNLKGKKLSKSQKSVKSGKKLSKSENSPNFNATKTGSKFLTPNAKMAFNRL